VGREEGRLSLFALFVVGCAGQTQMPCSVENVTGPVPGVAITVRANSCLLDRGQPATFAWTVTADATVPSLHVAGSSGCGSCLARTTDPSTWVSYVIDGTSSAGNGMCYCLCDVGCCAPDVDRDVQLATGAMSGTIEWSGRTWDGPSDTGNPMGDFFEPGHYQVTVSFDGGAAGTVSASLPIEIR
jgi:hypothetical protein